MKQVQWNLNNLNMLRNFKKVLPLIYHSYSTSRYVLPILNHLPNMEINGKISILGNLGISLERYVLYTRGQLQIRLMTFVANQGAH